MRLFPIDDPEHCEAAELLPWFVNGTLDSAERARVERHLAECLACKHEMASLRTLQAIFLSEDSDHGATQAFARLYSRIEQIKLAPSAKGLLRGLAMQWQAMRPWLRSAIIIQSILLVLSAVALMNQPTPQYYHTLGAPAAPANEHASLVVVFDAARPEREIRALLLRLHARITDGPSPEGAYTLEVAAAEQQRLLAQLRQEGLVIFSESGPQRLAAPR